VEITVPPDIADRMAAVRGQTGESYGRILLPALRERLAGVRLPSIPEALLDSLRRTPAAGVPESGDPAQDVPPSGRETAETAEDSPPPAPAQPSGGEEGPKSRRKTIAEQAAKFGRRKAG
jgi:hypothetical protein